MGSPCTVCGRYRRSLPEGCVCAPCSKRIVRLATGDARDVLTLPDEDRRLVLDFLAGRPNLCGVFREADLATSDRWS